MDENGANAPKGHFQELASKFAVEQWKVEGTVSEKWATIRSALTQTASSVLGREKHRHPDWFRENSNSLEPILQKRNQLYLKWLGSGLISDKRNFSETRSEARRAVRAAKNAWFTEETQQSRFGGKKVWKCIREMQYGRRRLVPSRLATVVDGEGNSCTTVASQQQQ